MQCCISRDRPASTYKPLSPSDRKEVTSCHDFVSFLYEDVTVRRRLRILQETNSRSSGHQHQATTRSTGQWGWQVSKQGLQKTFAKVMIQQSPCGHVIYGSPGLRRTTNATRSASGIWVNRARCFCQALTDPRKKGEPREDEVSTFRKSVAQAVGMNDESMRKGPKWSWQSRAGIENHDKTRI